MITVLIRYTIDMNKHAEFEQYARNWTKSIPRCGGELLGYFVPTKIAGPTNIAYALINFADLAAYQLYREALMKDDDARKNFAFAESSSCIQVEERSVLQHVK